jgi:coatomer subunit alpha
VRSANLDPLAYATAKTHGLEEECAAILEAAGISEEDIVLPEMESHTFDPPKPIEPMTSNWPLLPTSRTILERALTEEMGDLSLEDSATNGYADDLNSFEKGLNGEADLIDIGEGEGWEEANDEVEGWEIEGEKDDEMEIDNSLPTQGMSNAEYWVNNSPLAAHHIAAGSFESAMQLLNRQVGAVNFEPLKPKFLQVYQSSKTYLEANTGLPPMEIYVRDTTGHSRLPRPPVDYENIKTVRMKDALKMVTANKLEDAIVAFRDILHTLLLSAAATKPEADEVAKTVETVREYIIGLSTEVTRRNLDASTPEGIKRNLELAAYFTHFQLTPQHRGLAYMQAMTQFNKYKNIATAGIFAQKYIALGIGRPDAIERVFPSSNFLIF